jgi:hypothetical protein
MYLLHYAYVHKIFNNITFFVIVQGKEAKALSSLTRLNNFLGLVENNPKNLTDKLKKFRKEFSGFNFRPLVNELRNLEDQDDPSEIAVRKCRDLVSSVYRRLTIETQRNDLMNNFAFMSSYVQGKFHFYWNWLIEEEENIPQEVEQIVNLYGSEVVLWFLEEQDKHQSRLIEKSVSKNLSRDEVTEILAAVETSDSEFHPNVSDRTEVNTDRFRILIMRMKGSKTNVSSGWVKHLKLSVAVKLFEEYHSE